MNIIKTVMAASLSYLAVFPVYAQQYNNDGNLRFDQRVERHN
jgi:hypothetical protein